MVFNGVVRHRQEAEASKKMFLISRQNDEYQLNLIHYTRNGDKQRTPG